MRVVPLKQPSKMPGDFPAELRAIADRVESGEVTDFVCALVSDGGYEFVFPSSLNDSLITATLLQAQCLDRMRR